jgi:glutaminase
MTDPDTIDDTTADYEQLEIELIAQDRDAARVTTADVDETTAHQLVNELIEDDKVTPVADQRVLVHEPSGEAFDSITQLAVFHRGWQAATDVNAGGD